MLLMENSERKKHWENVYNTKQLKDVSWYQPIPGTSLKFLNEFKVAKDAKIIDVGGGDSFLVDNLLEQGYTDLTVLDISESALERAKKRLGEKASKVKWIVADASEFIPTEQYDFWHDRAAFHFLTSEKQTDDYVDAAKKGIKENGHLVLGTFSVTGPFKCSGLEVKQYSEESMSRKFEKYFDRIKCVREDHHTPFNTIQNFLFCSFKKLAA